MNSLWVVQKSNLLGLTLILNMVWNKCLKTMDIRKLQFKILWGADTTASLQNAGLIPNGLWKCSSWCCHSYIKTLHTVHHLRLRLSLQAFRTSLMFVYWSKGTNLYCICTYIYIDTIFSIVLQMAGSVWGTLLVLYYYFFFTFPSAMGTILP